MAQAAERVYSCPRCNKKVSAVSPLAGAVCLACNGVSSWQPIMEDIANRMRQQSSNMGALAIAMQILQQKGIYAKFMALYGHHFQQIMANMFSSVPLSTSNDSTGTSNQSASSSSGNDKTGDANSDEKQPEMAQAASQSKNEMVLSTIKQRAKDKSIGACGTAVRIAIQSSGKQWKQPPQRKINGQMSVCAKDFGPSLKAAGYAECVTIGADENAEQFEEMLEAGDVLVFDAVGNTHPYGHVEVYVGDTYETVKYGKKAKIKYISDFKQNTMIPWKDQKHNGIAVYRLK